MSVSFLTNLSEQEFKEFLKSALKEILSEGVDKFKSALPEILDVQQAAQLVKLKIATLYEKTHRKLIPHFKKGNRLYFNRAELEAWIKKGKVKTQEEIEIQAHTFLLSGKEKK